MKSSNRTLGNLSCSEMLEQVSVLKNLLESALYLPCFHAKTTDGCDQAETLIQLSLARANDVMSSLETHSGKVEPFSKLS